MKKIIFLLLLAMNISCIHDVSKEEYIGALFLPVYIDTSIPIRCESLLSMWTTSKMKIDTCDIDQESFMRIKAFIQKFQLADTGNVCDSRLLIQLDSMHLCIGTNNCISDLGSNLERNDMNTIYLIKWKIGYYNLYEKEDLKDIPEIKLFGIPRDYKHYVSDCNKPKKEFMMKVLRYKSKCCRIF